MTYLGDPGQDLAKLGHQHVGVFNANPQMGLLVFLYKLKILGVRRVTQSYGQVMTKGWKEPPCSFPLAVISLQREWIQFCPPRMADKDLKMP